MATRRKNPSRSTHSDSEKVRMAKPKCVALADKGINTGPEFARMMSALMGDIATGRITPGVANALCNAGGKLLKVVELENKYGSGSGKRAARSETLRLT